MSNERTPVKILPRHLGAVDHLHDVQQKATGLKVDRPLLLAPPVITAVGYENETGKLMGGFYIESVAELCLIGVDRASTEAAVQAAPYVIAFLKEKGYRWLHCKVPKGKRLPKELKAYFEQAGFACQDKRATLFSCDLRGK